MIKAFKWGEMIHSRPGLVKCGLADIREVFKNEHGYYILFTGTTDLCVYYTTSDDETKDTYKICTTSQTIFTFNEIPENVVAWFSPNININHAHTISLPLGYITPIKIPDPLPRRNKLLLMNMNFKEPFLRRPIYNY